MSIVGVDIGFGFTKATDGNENFLFKSVIGEAADIQYREQLMDTARRDPYLHLEIEDEQYFIGELAERQSNVRSYTLDQDQLVTKYAHTLALGALSQLVDSNDPIKLVTGLPISYYRRHRDQLTEILEGRHELTMVLPNGEREDKIVKVDRVRIVPQPFGSVFNLMLNQIGRISNQRFAKDKIGIIDIGFRTADYTISDKTRYSERGSRTTDSGISQAFKVIATALQEKSGVNVELYRLYDAVERSSIKIRGKSYDLTRIINHAFGQLATAVSSEVSRLWADDWDIDTIVVTGGGGAVLAPYLIPLLKGEVQAIDKKEDARMNNVLGYWKYGAHLWSGPETSAAHQEPAPDQTETSG